MQQRHTQVRRALTALEKAKHRTDALNTVEMQQDEFTQVTSTSSLCDVLVRAKGAVHPNYREILPEGNSCMGNLKSHLAVMETVLINTII